MGTRLDRSFPVDANKWKATLNRYDPRSTKQNRCINGFKKDRLSCEPSDVFSGANLKEAAFAFLLLKPFGGGRFFPGLAGELIESDSAPAQTCSWCRVRAFDSHVHEDFVVAFKVTNLAQRNVFGKSDKS